MRSAVIVPVPPLVMLRERSIGRRCSSVVHAGGQRPLGQGAKQHAECRPHDELSTHRRDPALKAIQLQARCFISPPIRRDQTVRQYWD
jgi:hypothetical protein